MEEVLLLASALVLGFLHGLGADHLMAIAALSIGATGEAPALRRARAMGVAVRFAIGHALLLALGAGGLIVLGWSLPLVVERSGEMLGGMLLIVFGVVGLWSVAAGRVYGHTHVHGHEQRAALPSARRPPRPSPGAVRALAPADDRRRGVRRQQPARADAAGALRQPGREAPRSRCS